MLHLHNGVYGLIAIIDTKLLRILRRQDMAVSVEHYYALDE